MGEERERVVVAREKWSGRQQGVAKQASRVLGKWASQI